MYAVEGSIDAAADTSKGDSLVSLFDDLVRVETRVYNALNDELRAGHGIVASQFEFLQHIRLHPESRIGDLASAFVVGVGATSKGINRLEQQGWLLRVRDPADGRSSFLRLTDAGKALVDEVELTFRRTLNDLIGATLGPDDVTAAHGVLSRLRRALDDTGAGTPIG